MGRLADYERGMGKYAGAAKFQDWYDAAKDALVREGFKTVAKGAGVTAAGTAVYGAYKWLEDNETHDNRRPASSGRFSVLVHHHCL